MTTEEAVILLDQAIAELREARREAAGFNGTTDAPDLIINTSEGEVTVQKNGTVIFQPDKAIIRKAFSDSRKMMIGGIAGRICPTCNGNGSI